MLSLSPANLDLSNYDYIIGIDEVGRGCIAGPVTVAGFVYTKNDVYIDGINDSKLVSSKRRTTLADQLRHYSHQIVHGSAQEIDSQGIARVIEQLIRDIIMSYQHLNAFFIIDGQFSTSFGSHTAKIIKADATYYPVAAASILAKVARDTMMIDLDTTYGQYQFAQHKGYATRLHCELIAMHGTSVHHRQSFAPIRTSGKQL